MKDAYYFPHDSNAKDDPKCSMLIEQLGCEGYGIYWILVETLRDQPDYRYPLNMLPILARKYNTTHEKIKVVVGNYGLFVVDEELFFSISLCKRMEKLEMIREKRKFAGLKSAEKRLMLNTGSTSVQQMPDICSTSIVKKSKEKKSKEEKNTIDYFSIFWKVYPRKSAKQDAVKAFEKLKMNDELMDKVMEGLFRQKESPDWLKDDGKFIPYPATWLNGKRWEDEH